MGSLTSGRRNDGVAVLNIERREKHDGIGLIECDLPSTEVSDPLFLALAPLIVTGQSVVTVGLARWRTANVIGEETKAERPAPKRSPEEIEGRPRRIREAV